MLVRLLWNGGLWVGLCAILRNRPLDFPIRGKGALRYALLGFATGLAVMLVAMVTMWSLKSATVTSSGQTLASALKNGATWIVLDLVGALGEEIYGRAVILVLAERFLGWRAAIVISGLVFSGIHLSNPGSTPLWLLRVFLQGAVLAYATFRTRSIWWSVGYHTGWNWIIAPLFGAAGSGYVDEGHILTFTPKGLPLITGGSVGPEGSVFAFIAVFAALTLLFATTRAPTTPHGMTST